MSQPVSTDTDEMASGSRAGRTARPESRRRVSGELPAIVVLAIVALLSAPLLQGLVSHNTLITELGELRHAWFQAALEGRGATRISEDESLVALPALADRLARGELERVSRFSPDLDRELQTLEEQLRSSSGSAELLATEQQFMRVREILLDLEARRDFAYGSLLVFLLLLAVAMIAVQRVQSNRLRLARHRETEELRMAQLTASIQEEERARLARELHDETAQTLSVARMLADKVPDTPYGQRLREVISSAIAEVKAVSYRLRPLADWTNDLGRMVRALAAKVEKDYELECHVALDGPLIVDWDDEVFIHVYRICHETLANVARHSGATQAWVSVGAHPNKRISIRLADHGRGMGGAPEGMGRRGMRERAELIHGQLRWYVPEGGGVGVELTVPFQNRRSRVTYERSADR